MKLFDIRHTQKPKQKVCNGARTTTTEESGGKVVGKGLQKDRALGRWWKLLQME